VTLNHVEFGLAEMKSRYQQAIGQLRLLEKQAEEKRAALSATRRDIEVWQKVQVLFAKASEFARQQLKQRVEETVTAALQAVFGDDDMRFEVVMRTVGGQPAAEWSVVSRYGDVVVAASPEDARGGGITDVVSLALRLALLELARPKPEGPVILDEPAKMVSREYLPNGMNLRRW